MTPVVLSLMSKVGRWLIGADRREREAQRQAQAQAERMAAALARAQAEANAQAERDRLAAQEQAGRMAVAARDAQAESVRVAATSTEPLVHVNTPTGGSYHVKREDWLTARAAKARDVPLCDWRGDPVQPVPGERVRTTLRLSTIEAATLTPTRIITVADYQAPSQEEQEQPSQSITM